MTRGVVGNAAQDFVVCRYELAGRRDYRSVVHAIRQIEFGLKNEVDLRG